MDIFKVFYLTVWLPIPDNVPSYQKHWPQWKPKFITIGELNAKSLREKLKKEYPSLIKIETKEEKQKYPTIELLTCGRGSEFTPKRFNLINLGDSRSSRGEYQGTRFTCQEYLKEGEKHSSELKKGETTRQESYYSQIWV